MPRTALALATLVTLTLNGSMALALMPLTVPAAELGLAPPAPLNTACGQLDSVCAIALRMMSPPPPRPASLIKVLPVPIPRAAPL